MPPEREASILVWTLSGPMVFFTNTAFDQTLLHALQFQKWVIFFAVRVVICNELKNEGNMVKWRQFIPTIKRQNKTDKVLKYRLFGVSSL